MQRQQIEFDLTVRRTISQEKQNKNHQLINCKFWFSFIKNGFSVCVLFNESHSRIGILSMFCYSILNSHGISTLNWLNSVHFCFVSFSFFVCLLENVKCNFEPKLSWFRVSLELLFLFKRSLLKMTSFRIEYNRKK